jgi:hypothetical protein
VDSYVADFLVEFNTTNTGVALFLLIFAGFIFCEFCLMNLIRMRLQVIGLNYQVHTITIGIYNFDYVKLSGHSILGL